MCVVSPCPAGIAQVLWNAQWTWMDACDQPGCERMCHLSESYLDILLQLHMLLTITQPLPVWTVQDPWIHEVISLPVHIHLLNTIGNKARQIRKNVSCHQQSNVSVDGPRRGIKHCVVQLARVPSWPSTLKAYIDDVSLNGLHADTRWWSSIEICSNLQKGCTSITHFSCHHCSVSCKIFFPTAVMSVI